MVTGSQRVMEWREKDGNRARYNAYMRQLKATPRQLEKDAVRRARKRAERRGKEFDEARFLRERARRMRRMGK